MYEWQEVYAFNEKSHCVDMRKLEGRFSSKAQALHYLGEFGPITEVKSIGYRRVLVTVKGAGRFGQKRWVMLGKPTTIADINPLKEIDAEFDAA